MPILGLAPSSKPVKPAHFDIEKVIRPNILALHPYRCARDDYQSGILLDANENSLGHSIPSSSSSHPQKLNGSAITNGTADVAAATVNGDSVHPELQSMLDLELNRYPDPSHDTIKRRIAAMRGLPDERRVFLGVGSDEVIDLLMRVCVAPGAEKILITPPTYGMYAVCAHVNDVGIVRCELNLSGERGEGGEEGRFSVVVDEVKKALAADPSIKLVFLCSPGNPTGTLVSLNAVRSLLEYEPFGGIVVVDEAYIDFAGDADKVSAATLVEEYANLCVLQTLSKSFGLAAIRLGVALAQPPLIQILTNTKAPYNISTPTAHLALAALSPAGLSGMRAKASTLVASRAQLLAALARAPFPALGVGRAVGANDANFVMVPVLDGATRSRPDNARAERVYTVLAEGGLVVRFRGREAGCEGCLRMTIGTEEENRTLLERLEGVLRLDEEGLEGALRELLEKRKGGSS